MQSLSTSDYLGVSPFFFFVGGGKKKCTFVASKTIGQLCVLELKSHIWAYHVIRVLAFADVE